MIALVVTFNYHQKLDASQNCLFTLMIDILTGFPIGEETKSSSMCMCVCMISPKTNFKYTRL